MIERYYNLFDPAKHYTQLLFRAGDGLFPDYRTWTGETIVLHAAWSGAFVLGAALLMRGRARASVRGLPGTLTRLRRTIEARRARVRAEQDTAGVTS